MKSIKGMAFSLVVLASCVLPAPALADDLVELRDGTVVNAERVDLLGDYVVLHIKRGKDGSKKQLRMRIADVDLRSALHARAKSIDESDAVAWLELAAIARGGGLFDLAEAGYSQAARHSEVAKAKNDEFVAARPAEESRHLFEAACIHFRAGDRDAAAASAQGAVSANSGGPDALMATELLKLLAGADEADAQATATALGSAPSPNSIQNARTLRRLAKLAARGGTRLRRARAGELGSRPAAVRSATRDLGDVAERLTELQAHDLDDDARTRAARLLEMVQEHRVQGLLLVADLGMAAGYQRTPLAAVHEVLSIRPDEALALDLRERLLDDAADLAAAGRDLLYRGSRILYHPYPYPARDNYSGIGLVPTRDPLRGLGRIPYTRPWDVDNGGGAVVVRRRR